MNDSTVNILAGIIRIGIALIVLIFIISLYDDPPFEEPAVEKQIVQPTEPALPEVEWYPNMTPDITFDQGNEKGRNWIY